MKNEKDTAATLAGECAELAEACDSLAWRIEVGGHTWPAQAVLNGAQNLWDARAMLLGEPGTRE